jgi:ABC-type transporter lipoprotein component MlaA
MLKKSYILNFIIDAIFNIQNKIFVNSVLGLGGVVFDSAWGIIIPPHKRNTA